LQSQRFDAVFHFAARAVVGDSMRDPADYFLNNVTKPLAMLDCLRNAGVRKFIFSSSAATYGNPVKVPIAEDHPQLPVNPYGETKLMVERILHWYAVAYGFSSVAFRYFNAAGGAGELGELHDRESHVIPLMLQTISGRRAVFEMYGDDYDTPDGSCVRDYVHVLDIAQAHLLGLAKLEDPGFRAYNIGTATPCSVLELARIVEEVTGLKLNLRQAARRAGDPAVLCATNEKLRNELGWTPQHSDLRNIVRTAWAWEQKQAERND
jgi:UDP-glucose 4-epimerase